MTTSARTQDRRPVPPVRARVHPDAAAGRPGDRARELEAAEPGGTRAVQADRVRRRRRPRAAVRRRRDLGQLARRAGATSASTPASAASTFEPSPTTTTPQTLAPPRSAAPPRARRPSRGCANARAGPPVPIVVSRESSTPSSIDERHAGSPRRSPRRAPRLPDAERDDDVARPRPGERERGRVVERRRPAGAHVRRQPRRAPACPLTPSRGSSRAPITSVTTATSASPSASAELATRAAACARRRAAGRRRSVVRRARSRAVRSVAASSVGLCP